MSEIQPADPAARRTALIIVSAVAGAAAIAAFTQFRPALEAWVMEDPRARARLVLGGAAVLIAGPLLAFAQYFRRLGAETISTGRYPPPGTRVIRDVVVTQGDAALRRGRLMKYLAAFLAGGALVLALLLWRLTSLVPLAPR